MIEIQSAKILNKISPDKCVRTTSRQLRHEFLHSPQSKIESRPRNRTTIKQSSSYRNRRPSGMLDLALIASEPGLKKSQGLRDQL